MTYYVRQSVVTNSSTTSICNLRIFDNITPNIGPAMYARDRGFELLNIITQRYFRIQWSSGVQPVYNRVMSRE